MTEGRIVTRHFQRRIKNPVHSFFWIADDISIRSNDSHTTRTAGQSENPCHTHLDSKVQHNCRCVGDASWRSLSNPVVTGKVRRGFFFAMGAVDGLEIDKRMGTNGRIRDSSTDAFDLS
jgi:hypothetical protein